MRFFNHSFCFAVLGIVLLSGCGTTPPPEFNGKWRPVNRFSSDTQAIPLHSALTYYATPMDHTVKGLLTRWAEDAGFTLVYQVGMDYTLHQPVAGIRTTSLASALGELSKIYRAQGIEVVLDGRVIMVRPISTLQDSTEGGEVDGR